jgi:hypothetical protein
MSRLLELQQEFSLAVADLILQAQQWDFKITLGDAFRSAEECERQANIGAGIINSLHGERLAIDLNFFHRGQYVNNTTDLKIFGDYWKKKGFLYRWGGDFTSRPDGNHFSITPDGVRE